MLQEKWPDMKVCYTQQCMVMGNGYKHQGMEEARGQKQNHTNTYEWLSQTAEPPQQKNYF